MVAALPTATGVFITHKRVVQPVLRDARRIGPADSVSLIRLTAETTSSRSLAGRLILVTLALLASGLAAYVAAYLSRLLGDELLLTLDVVFGLFVVWTAVVFGGLLSGTLTVLVVKLKAQRSGGPPQPWSVGP
jgi:hypothetical protein